MNYFSSLKNWQISLACTVLLICGVAVLRAQAPARPDRPPSVPEEYLATPVGYFHPSCVQGLAEGDILHKDEKVIEHKDGSIDAIPACAFPHYKPSGERLFLDGEGPASGEKVTPDGEGGGPPEIAHEYVSAATMEKHPTNTYYGALRANWIVPPAPTNHFSQIIYLFPGLEDYSSAKTTILQPVLGWNVVFKDGPNFPNVWTLSSWNCCVDGTVQHSTFIRTEPGHEIFGEMFLACTPGSARCSRFSVNTVDQTTNKSTELVHTSSFGLNFNWAFAAALEVYRVYECNDYPAGEDGSTQFYFLGLYDQDLQPVKQGWVPWKRWEELHMTPECNYGVSGGFKSGLPYIKLTY